MNIETLERIFSKDMELFYFHERTNKIKFSYGVDCRESENVGFVDYDPQTNYLFLEIDTLAALRWKLHIHKSDGIIIMDTSATIPEIDSFCVYNENHNTDIIVYYEDTFENNCFKCAISCSDINIYIKPY